MNESTLQQSHMSVHCKLAMYLTCITLSDSVFTQSMRGRMTGFSFSGRQRREMREPATQELTLVASRWCSSCSCPVLVRTLRCSTSNSWRSAGPGVSDFIASWYTVVASCEANSTVYPLQVGGWVGDGCVSWICSIYTRSGKV